MRSNETAINVLKPTLMIPNWLVVISASTGGPQALAQILPQFPADFPGTIIVMQQMRPGFTVVLTDSLSRTCKLPVSQAVDGQALQKSKIIIIPSESAVTFGNAGSTITPGLSIYLDDVRSDPEKYHNRVNDAMTSAARVFGYKTTGVLLTGVGNDGCEGMRAIANAGGVTMVQDEVSSVVHDLPASAINARVAQQVLPLWSIADKITAIVMGDANAAAA